MKIIKKGTKKTVRFKCDFCDCEFVAETGEFITKFIPTIECSIYEGTIKNKEYLCKCPCCNACVSKLV